MSIYTRQWLKKCDLKSNDCLYRQRVLLKNKNDAYLYEESAASNVIEMTAFL